jgi:hypothetical protein
VATKNVRDGECIIAVPKENCIDLSKASEVFKNKISSKSLKTNDAGILALYIAHEMCANQKSPIGEYLELLKSVKPNGLFGMIAEEVNEFCESTTRDIRLQVEFAKSDYRRIMTFLSKYESEKFVESFQYHLTEDLFIHALGIVKEHSLYVNNELIIIPGSKFLFLTFLKFLVQVSIS